jgi:hypothetical protein
MKTLSNNVTPHGFEPKDKENDKYYLMAMLVTGALLFVVAYYDQVVGHFIR